MCDYFNYLAGDKSDDLLKVALDIIDNNYCNSLYGKMPRLRQGIIDSQVCAGYLEGGKDTCQVCMLNLL